MTVFSMYTKRLFSRSWAVILTAAAPVLILMLSAMVSEGGTIRVAFIDEDATVLSAMVYEAVSPASHFVELEQTDEHSIMDALIQGRAEYVMIIPSGLEQSVVGGEVPEIRTYSLQGTDVSRPVRSAADALLSASANIARHSGGDTERFHQMLEDFRGGSFSLVTRTFRNERGALTPTQVELFTQLIGMVSIAMLYLGIGSSLVFLKDIEQKTYYRSLASPVTVRRFSLEANGAFLLPPLIQSAAATLSLKLVLPQIPISILLGIGMILAVFALAAVSLTMAVASAARTVHRTAVLSNFIIVPMAMLGGVLWPVEIMPPFLQRAAGFLPLRWLTSAVSSMLSGTPVLQLLGSAGILLLFALVFQLLGAWKRVDVMR